MKKVLSNFFYQAVFQITKIIIPIITIPIVSNAIGPEGIGKYNYTNSIAQYFVLFASLGVSIYGNREVALANNSNMDLSKTFSEIFVFKACLSIITLIIYYSLIMFSEDRVFLLIQSMTILGVLFDISWFFMGIEEFGKTSLVNLLVQGLTLILIVMFVRQPSDTINYIFIQASGTMLSQLLVWPFLLRKIRFVKVKFSESFSHVKGSIQYFIPQVAIILYTNLNKTILGIFLGAASVGFYTTSLTLNNVFITIITTLDIVLLPHMSGLFAKSEERKIVVLMEKTVHLQLFFSIPIMFGVLTVYDKLIPWFFGDKFLFINSVVPLFSILIVIMPLGMAISRQYLMPIGKTNEYNRSVIIGAIINITSNLILIPMIGFFGVVFSNILAESFVTFVRLFSFLRATSFKFQIKKIVSIIFCSFIMLVITRLITDKMSANIVTNLVQVVIAIPIFFTATTLLKSNMLIELYKRKKK